MDERKAASLPSSLVNGRLEGISVPDLLWSLCHRRATGVLQVAARGVTKKLYIDGGRIVFAASSDPNDRLGEMLLRDGIVTLDQLEKAIAQLSSGKRLGAILVESGHLSPDNLVRGVLSQVKGIVLGVFSWEDGEYAFLEGPLPTEEVVTLGMKTAEILLQGIRQIRSFTRIRKSVGSLSGRFRLQGDWSTILDGLDIRDGERMLLQRLAEAGDRGLSIDALCHEVFLSNYEIYQALWAFRVLEIVVEVDAAKDGSAAAGLMEGRLEKTGFPEVLVRLCREGETGVLHVTRGTLERTFHIKEGRCVFATSNAIDDGFLAHLLRRGVISLRDREETARRLLSNKRVGTILLEMGVIDESDLRATVREQLSEIVFDTFRWEQGDFVFRGGELPTIEEITLDRGVEDLAFAGMRRVTSWSRVREGCGGLGARLVLMPQYLSVLDKMSVGPEEWELISLLKSPKSVVQVCRESVLGDFRSCQILWALRLLGAIGEAPVEASVDAALNALETKPVTGPDAERQAPSAPQPEIDVEPAPVAAADPTPIPVSEMDDSAEIVSEPWRLAAEKAPEAPRIAISPVEPMPESAIEPTPEPTFDAIESSTDAAPAPAIDATPEPAMTAASEPAVATPAEAKAAHELDAPAPTERHDEVLPRFELGAPGTGLEEMNVDVRPRAAGRDFELGAPGSIPADALFDAPPAPIAPEPAAPISLDSAPRQRDDAPVVFDVPARAEAPAPDVAMPMPLSPASQQHDDRGIDDASRTTRIAPEDLAAALRSFEESNAPKGDPMSREAMPATEVPMKAAEPQPAEAAPAPSAPAWDPPEGLDGAIAAFNARHIVLFRALRTEVGAGAANFVRSCRGALASEFVELFAAAELRADGSWDPESLKRAVIERRMANADQAFRELVDREVERLRMHLGEKRASAIAGQLAAIS